MTEYIGDYPVLKTEVKFKHNAVRLTHLDLSYNHINQNLTQLLFEIPNFWGLVSLDLSHNLIGQVTAQNESSLDDSADYFFEEEIEDDGGKTEVTEGKRQQNDITAS